MSFRFIHTADWQLGAPFGGYDNDLAGELKAARRNVVSSIAAVAVEQNANHVIVAGDVWDSETPTEATLAQPLDKMAEASDLTWWLMPGNHDLVRQNMLWSRIAQRCPANVRLLLEPVPVEAEKDVWFLPGPWDSKQPGRDLTAWTEEATTPAGAVRIGIGHGSVTDFSSESGDRSIIAKDRAQKAQLDYLALGDWHGMQKINSRTWYSGTPEPDRHRRNKPGFVLSVEIGSAGGVPKVDPIRTGAFEWLIIDFDIRSKDDLSDLETALMGEGNLDKRLVRLNLRGRITMLERQSLNQLLTRVGPSLASLDVRDSDLEVRIQSADLDTLDQQGSVRRAAETLLNRKLDADLALHDREVAARALELLFTFANAKESGFT